VLSNGQWSFAEYTQQLLLVPKRYQRTASV
jgi:hypothetical protein